MTDQLVLEQTLRDELARQKKIAEEAKKAIEIAGENLKAAFFMHIERGKPRTVGVEDGVLTIEFGQQVCACELPSLHTIERLLPKFLAVRGVKKLVCRMPFGEDRRGVSPGYGDFNYTDHVGMDQWERARVSCVGLPHVPGQLEWEIIPV
ncbi:hypothetical protein FJZ48_00120 [Candidatus Uhrbacteria bacterium]|nr:hypothetical protein [Candidatus Uhrbacteria bacterium]